MSGESYPEEKTEVLYDPNEIVRRVVKQCYTIKYAVDACIDLNSLSLFVIPTHPVTKAYIDMKDRAVRIRFISEITIDNLEYCKELMKIAVIEQTHSYRTELFLLFLVSLSVRQEFHQN